MDTSFFRLSNFLIEQDFLKLQNSFLSMDENIIYVVKNTELIDNPNINILEAAYNKKIEGYDNIYVKKEFVDDYLKPGIERIHINHLNDFKKEVYDRSLFTKALKEGYYLALQNDFEKYKEVIPNLEYLPNEVRSLLIKEIRIIVKKIKNYINNPYPNLYRKVEFNWCKADIVTLFYLLKKNKFFNKSTSSDLGKIIDSSFKYLNQKGVHCDISESRKDLNSIEGGKGIKKAISRLKKIFSNPDFYDY